MVYDVLLIIISIVVLVLVALLIGFVVGYLLGKHYTKQEEKIRKIKPSRDEKETDPISPKEQRLLMKLEEKPHVKETEDED